MLKNTIINILDLHYNNTLHATTLVVSCSLHWFSWYQGARFIPLSPAFTVLPMWISNRCHLFQNSPSPCLSICSRAPCIIPLSTPTHKAPNCFMIYNEDRQTFSAVSPQRSSPHHLTHPMIGEKLGSDQPSCHPCASLDVEEADSHLHYPSPCRHWQSTHWFRGWGQGTSQHGAFTPFILHSFIYLCNSLIDQIKWHQCTNFHRQDCDVFRSIITAHKGTSWWGVVGHPAADAIAGVSWAGEREVRSFWVRCVFCLSLFSSHPPSVDSF